ncbi:hypothetical protein HOLleu_01414 [Holothuria leucospilota]|uniref:Immunoglobulin domain-containing protein n=1 Tax=Holothuria leucospilota TaxID=206669 RepID=A0A9Q1CQS9_HOLLE|nr:hypothetical protein HOLleu_01414 [Holothuria leucospilota]
MCRGSKSNIAMGFNEFTCYVLLPLTCLIVCDGQEMYNHIEPNPVTTWVENTTSLILNCNVKRAQSAQWMFNGDTIILGRYFTSQKSSGNMKLLDDYSLLIRNIDNDSGGWYQCLDERSVVEEYHLKVKGKNKTKFNSNVTWADEMDFIIIRCPVEEIQSASWMFNNVTVTIGENYAVAIPNGKITLLDDYSLLIRKINIEDDGLYRCFKNGVVFKERRLMVKGKRLNSYVKCSEYVLTVLLNCLYLYS